MMTDLRSAQPASRISSPTQELTLHANSFKGPDLQLSSFKAQTQENRASPYFKPLICSVHFELLGRDLVDV